MMDSRFSKLLERGLRHFALGEVENAVGCWRQVLEADRSNRRAREYLELVATVLPPEEAVRMLGGLLAVVAPGLAEEFAQIANESGAAVGGTSEAAPAPRTAAAGAAAPTPATPAAAQPTAMPAAATPPAVMPPAVMPPAAIPAAPTPAAATPAAGMPSAGMPAATGPVPTAPSVQAAGSAAREFPPAGGIAQASAAAASRSSARGHAPSRPDPAAQWTPPADPIEGSAALDARIAGHAVAAWFEEGAPAGKADSDPFAAPISDVTDPWDEPSPIPPPPAAPVEPPVRGSPAGPPADTGHAWQEWHSEVDFGASELPPLDGRDPQRLPAPAAPTPGPGSTGWDLETGGPQVEIGDGTGGDALDLVDDIESAPVSVPSKLEGQKTQAAGSKRTEADTLMVGARELFELGDFSGSLELVQKALEVDPAHPQALEYLERNQGTLVQMYESKVGSLDTRPRVVLRPDEIVWLNLDHRAGFVLAQIDGTITVDDLYALSGLSRLDTAKILAELVEQGVIAA